MGSCHASSFKIREDLKTNLGKRRDILRNLYDSMPMPRRIASLLEANGGSTKYQGQNKQQLTLFSGQILDHFRQTLVPSPVPLVPNPIPTQSKIKIQAQLGLG